MMERTGIEPVTSGLQSEIAARAVGVISMVQS
jgi:hypothetical protein